MKKLLKKLSVMRGSMHIESKPQEMLVGFIIIHLRPNNNLNSGEVTVLYHQRRQLEKLWHQFFWDVKGILLIDSLHKGQGKIQSYLTF